MVKFDSDIRLTNVMKNWHNDTKKTTCAFDYGDSLNTKHNHVTELLKLYQPLIDKSNSFLLIHTTY